MNGRVLVPDSNDAFDIVLSPDVGAVRGVASPGAQVVLIPGNPERIDLFRNAGADSEGRFIIPDAVPGDYTLTAWEALEPYAYFDPGLIAQAQISGKPIHVSESSSQIMDVTTIPAGH